MEKQFVSYEIALKLKEIGFDEPVFATFNYENKPKLREDFINEGKREGKREGRQEGRRAQQCYTIEMMLNKNYDLAEICSIAGCDPALVEKVREKKGGKK